jgi:hypothetical protein
MTNRISQTLLWVIRMQQTADYETNWRLSGQRVMWMQFSILSCPLKYWCSNIHSCILLALMLHKSRFNLAQKVLVYHLSCKFLFGTRSIPVFAEARAILSRFPRYSSTTPREQYFDYSTTVYKKILLLLSRAGGGVTNNSTRVRIGYRIYSIWRLNYKWLQFLQVPITGNWISEIPLT